MQACECVGVPAPLRSPYGIRRTLRVVGGYRGPPRCSDGPKGGAAAWERASRLTSAADGFLGHKKLTSDEPYDVSVFDFEFTHNDVRYVGGIRVEGRAVERVLTLPCPPLVGLLELNSVAIVSRRRGVTYAAGRASTP
jgi:hypothetical protein